MNSFSSGIHWQRFFCQFRKSGSDKLVKFMPLFSQRTASVSIFSVT